MAKYIQHKIYHFNHFKLYDLNCMTALNVLVTAIHIRGQGRRPGGPTPRPRPGAGQGGSSGAEGVVIAESPAGNAQELAS